MPRPAALLLTIAIAAAPAVPLVSQSPTLRTRWADSVDTRHPWPEYPRPQMVRSRWTNLNGPWSYAITALDAPRPTRWDGTITVPFAIESQLSGVRRNVSDSERLWYHRTFAAPPLRPGERLLLHFGAVDWDAKVLINGASVGEHQGGYDPFTFDITSALRAGSTQDLVVAVSDPTDHGPQPRGKQVLKPQGIWYTAVTGIWQTVWLEPVPANHITDLLAVPDIDASTVTITTTVASHTGATVTARIAVPGAPTITARGTVDAPLVVHLPHAHLWSPADPYLYHFSLALSTGDAVESYFGMRKISVGPDSAGVERLQLNNLPLFEFGTLDQGWWPDGLYTAPTNSALLSDLITLKHLGFNLVRKHVKVEPARWYHDADSLGMLVWQDMPSGDNNTDAGRAEFAIELHRVIDALRDHPAIVMWVPFNEGWGEHDVEETVSWITSHDPSRLVDNASGWTDHHVGDVSDMHNYPGPGMPPLEPHRASVLGEFGGLGLPLADHTWVPSKSWGYRRFTSVDSLDAAYRNLMAQLRWLVSEGLSAAVYTQTSDVESEVNGVMTYDRAVIKLPATDPAIFTHPLRAVPLIATSEQAPQDWRFTIDTPPGNWYAVDFDDGSWTAGRGGFGTPDTPGAIVGTPWKSPDIWLRRTVALPAVIPDALAWRMHHDEDADVYINGALALKAPGYTTSYQMIPMSAAARALLHPGNNIIAVHVHQTEGGQYFDLGIDRILTP